METTNTPKPSRRRKVLFTGFGVFLLGVLAFAIFFWVNFQTVVVKGDSMDPTLQNGQRLLITKAYWLVGDIRKNDIIVVHRPESGEVVIKRVYAMQGETVDFYNVPDNWNLAQGEYIVPPDSYYVLGDNRPVSDDSRLFGPVRSDVILGKVVRAELGTESKKPKAVAQK
jgi:signal peptidase I